MKLVGKKLYRVGSLKLFKAANDPSPTGDANTTVKASNRGDGGNRRLTEEEKRIMKEAAMRKKLLAEMDKEEKAEWKGEAKRDLYDPEQKAIFEKRKALAEGMGGELQKAGAERGLQAQMAAAGAGRGGAAQRMRGLARAGETGVRSAAALGAQSGQAQSQALGAAGAGRFGMQKSDKAGRLGYYQKSRGLDVAQRAAEMQASATRSANSKASGGEIFKAYKRKNGPIKGPGTETSDSIKAKLSDGEFVVNAKTVRGIGESMGAKGKDQSRKLGSGFLYDLQTKYGDKKPVNKAFGGLEMAEIGSAAMSSGLLGKKLEAVGEVTDAGISAKKGLDAKKAKATKEAASEKRISGLEAKIHKQEKASGLHPREERGYKKGGEANLGKGVKAKRKFREAIGWESDKIFEKKAEKAYKEGDTGYKNWKGDSVVKLGRGGFLGSLVRTGIGAGIGYVTSGGNPAGAVVGGVSAAGKEKKAEDKRKANLAIGEAKAHQKIQQSGKQLASEDVELKKGGSVIDRPKLNVEKLLKEPLGKDYRLPEHGDDIDSPSKKKLEPRSTKKPPPWMRKKEKPVKMNGGGLLDLLKKNVKRGKESPKDIKERLIREKDRDWQGKESNKTKKRVLKSLKKRTSWKDRVKKGKENAYTVKGKLRKISDPSSKALGIKPSSLPPLDIKKMLKEVKGDLKRIGNEDKQRKLNKKFLKEEKSRQDASDLDLKRKKGARAFLLKQDLIPHKEMSIKERFSDRAKKRDEQDDKEAKQYEKKEGFLSKLGDRFTSGEWFGSSKDILAAKRREKDKEQAKREKSGEDFKAKKAAQDDKIAMAKEMAAERKKGIEPKEEKSWWGKMSDSDKATVLMGAGKGVLSGIKGYHEAKDRRKQRLLTGLTSAHDMRAKAGHALIGAPVSLRKGGRVSFKDVLKAKKKMGY